MCVFIKKKKTESLTNSYWLQIAPAYQQQRSAGDMSDDVSRTGIKLQPRREQPEGVTTDYVIHGNASRRLRLQTIKREVRITTIFHIDCYSL